MAPVTCWTKASEVQRWRKIQSKHNSIISYDYLGTTGMSCLKSLEIVDTYLAVVVCSQPGRRWRTYSRITSTQSPSFCMTTFITSLTNLTTLLPQSHECSCYLNRRILAPPPLWPQKHTDQRAHTFAHCPDLWHHARLANITCAWSWRLCGMNPTILVKGWIVPNVGTAWYTLPPPLNPIHWSLSCVPAFLTKREWLPCVITIYDWKRCYLFELTVLQLSCFPVLLWKHPPTSSVWKWSVFRCVRKIATGDH
jgi:hypothetical protein